ncbi:hypothetical protein KU348_24405, partial [Salmonella enterica subsp. enterica serovar Mbandaka]|nr:hypothetical protein [Salmonella enterica subsp. enterica serovar Mbandaka]
NFAVVPHVHERDAFWEMKEKGEAYQQPGQYEEIHMPKNSGAGGGNHQHRMELRINLLAEATGHAHEAQYVQRHKGYKETDNP